MSTRLGGPSRTRKTPPKPKPSGLDNAFKTAENVGLALMLLGDGVDALVRRSERKAARAEDLLREDAERQLCAAHLTEFPAAARRVVRSPSTGLRALVSREGQQQRRDAVRDRAAEQAEEDELWRLLSWHDPDCVINAVNDAFADNTAPSMCIDAGDDGSRYISLVVTAPPMDVVLRAVWNNGKTLMPRSDQEVARVYGRMLSALVLVTVKEALLSAPAAHEARIALVRWDARGVMRLPRLVALYTATFDRRLLDTDWPNAVPEDLVAQPADARFDARDGKPWRTLPLRKHPDLEILLCDLERAAELTPTLRPTIR